MLTDKDVELIKQTREQLTQHRTEPIEVVHLVKGEKDPFTGDYTTEPVTETVEGTWRYWTSQSPGSNDIEMVGGIKFESGDVIAEIPFNDVDLSDVSEMRLARTGEPFIIQAKDEIGLGAINRHYVLLRKET